MKTNYLIIFTLLFSTSLLAQKVVALHSSTNGIQYFDDDTPLQSAYTAAVDNDTIYLPGGSMAPPLKFEKKITIYGAGHYPDATEATFKTIISGFVNLSDEADGFHLEGVYISGDIQFDSDEAVNDVTIKRCKFSTIRINGSRTSPAENNSFIENVITGNLYIDNLINSSFFNNIIQGGVANARNMIFLNNLFLYTGSYSNSQVIAYANNSMFKNNIFLQENNDICEGVGASTWSHNIFCTSSTSPQLGLDPILIDNYFMDRADILVNETANVFDYTHDYHLQAGAAANLGDDGYETGIYGGYYPWKDLSIPVNPHISSKSISGTSDSNGMIQVDINVHAQNR